MSTENAVQSSIDFLEANLLTKDAAAALLGVSSVRFYGLLKADPTLVESHSVFSRRFYSRTSVQALKAARDKAVTDKAEAKRVADEAAAAAKQAAADAKQAAADAKIAAKQAADNAKQVEDDEYDGRFKEMKVKDIRAHAASIGLAKSGPIDKVKAAIVAKEAGTDGDTAAPANGKADDAAANETVTAETKTPPTDTQIPSLDELVK